MIKKFFAKLVNWQAQRGNNAERIHDADQQDQAKLNRDKLKQEDRDSRGEGEDILERTPEPPPTEGQILGPSDSHKDSV